MGRPRSPRPHGKPGWRGWSAPNLPPLDRVRSWCDWWCGYAAPGANARHSRTPSRARQAQGTRTTCRGLARRRRRHRGQACIRHRPRGLARKTNIPIGRRRPRERPGRQRLQKLSVARTSPGAGWGGGGERGGERLRSALRKTTTNVIVTMVMVQGSVLVVATWRGGRGNAGGPGGLAGRGTSVPSGRRYDCMK